MFENRESAAELLAGKLRIMKLENPVVLFIPRGSAIMGEIIAETLNAPLDVVLTRKIGWPFNPELAIGAVSENGDVYLNEWAQTYGIKKEEIREQIGEVTDLLRQRRQLYAAGRPPLSLKGKTAVIVDDGIATGATVIAAIKFVRTQNPQKIIVATAVIPPENYEKIKVLCDDLVVLDIPEDFFGVGQFFGDFPQVPDEEVIDILARARRRHDSTAAAMNAIPHETAF